MVRFLNQTKEQEEILNDLRIDFKRYFDTLNSLHKKAQAILNWTQFIESLGTQEYSCDPTLSLSQFLESLETQDYNYDSVEKHYTYPCDAIGCEFQGTLVGSGFADGLGIEESDFYVKKSQPKEVKSTAKYTPKRRKKK